LFPLGFEQKSTPRGPKVSRSSAKTLGNSWLCTWNSDAFAKMPSKRLFPQCERDRIMHEVANSLRQRRIDYIDVCQIHWLDPSVPVEETAQAMRASRRARTYAAGSPC
jgi:aryl-alcohol dehydrogenase-like predicted oxidoreductase